MAEERTVRDALPAEREQIFPHRPCTSTRRECNSQQKKNANLLQFPAKSFASICSPTPPPRAMICCIFYELSPCHSAQLLQQVTGPIGRAAGRRRQCMGTTKLCMEKSNLRHHRELLQLVVAYRASRVGLGFVMA